MNKLENYVNNKYKGNPYWFKEECQDYWHKQRIMDILDNKEYLAGKHKIKYRTNEVYNGKEFITRKIALQYAKTLLSFETAFLLKNPVTLISNDLDALNLYKAVYREGKYHQLDYEILSRMVKYGEVYEYLYIDDNNRIKSILINAEDSYPVYAHNGEMIAFIEYYVYDGISYYTVFTEDNVYKYNDEDGNLHFTEEYSNLSGLPIPYILPSEMDCLKGNASFREYIDVLDNMEDLISKYMDSFYKFLNPIPLFKGTKLNTKDGGIDENAVGYALQLAEDADFEFVNSKMDFNSFKTMWNTLKQSLLDISMTPAVSMNSQEISNLSEVSIRMLYSMAEIKGADNALYLKQGFEKRWGIMKKLLRELDYNINEDAYIDCQFNMNIPQNESEIISNLVKATDGNIMSVDRAVEVNPYVNDVNNELERLKGINKDIEDTSNDIEQEDNKANV